MGGHRLDTGIAEQPRRLLRLFLIVASLSLVVILTAAGIGLNFIFTKLVVHIAENESVAVGESILHLEGFMLLTTTSRGDQELSLPHSRLEQFDQKMRLLLKPFNILKIKVFSPEWLILYSTDSQIIGQVDFGNQHLNNALAGQNDSRLESKNKVLDLDFEEKFDVDVVEAYIPIRTSTGKVIGSFEIYRDVTPFREQIRRSVISSVALLGIILLMVIAVVGHLFNKRIHGLQQVLERLAENTTIDVLTGLTDREHSLVHAREEMARYQQQSPGRRQSFSVVLLDIDHFKSFNDVHDMETGDQVLAKVADLLSAQLRSFDSIGRYGGDKFMLLLPDTGQSQAEALADEIRRAVEDHPITIDDNRLKVTISGGVASVRISDVSVEEPLQRAELALYSAKQAGRNRIAGQTELPRHQVPEAN